LRFSFVKILPEYMGRFLDFPSEFEIMAKVRISTSFTLRSKSKRPIPLSLMLYDKTTAKADLNG